MGQLQYISTTNGAFNSVLAQNVTQDSVIECKFLSTAYSSIVTFGEDYADVKVRHWWGDDDMYWYDGGGFVVTSLWTLNEEHTVSLSKSEYKWNGVKVYDVSGTCIIPSTPYFKPEVKGRIYYFKITDNGVDRVNLVGWEENGVVGLKDLVSGNFYQPSSGTWTAGPPYTPPTPPTPSSDSKIYLGSTNLVAGKIKLGYYDVSAIYLGTSLLYPPTTPQPTPPIVSNCVCFEALEAGAEVQLQKGSNLSTPQVYLYASTDNGQTFTRMERNQSFSMPNIGDKVYIYGNNTSMSRDSSRYYSLIVNNKQVSVSGDLTRLLNPNGVTTLPDYAFSRLFQNSKGIVDASGLTIPVTTVGQYALHFMFAGCTTLQYAPTQLGATNIGKGCYSYMFNNCTSLITVPTLPATTLAESCYHNMFASCTSLTTAPALPALTMENWCYQQMFEGCSSLTSAPVLPALTLDTDCYYCMFRNCTSLNSVTCLATDISALDCTDSWLENVSSTGTFTKNPNMSNWTTGIDGIPTGWTVVDAQ